MNGNLRRLLFLSYWVPPRNAIGTIRSAHILKHLGKFGWDVTTITAPFEGNGNAGAKLGPYIETGFCDVKATVKRYTGIGNRSTSEALRVGSVRYGVKRTPLQRVLFELSNTLTYPDDYVGWLPYATGAVRKAVAAGSYDALLSSSPPITTNLAAALACRTLPWIADFRDLWAEDDSSERSLMQRVLDDPLERACIAQAAALTASSELSAQRFRARYPGKHCFAISSGFDKEEWQRVGFGREQKCTLLYAGALYRGKRDPTLLFTALRQIFNEGLASRDELCVDFYADREPWLMKLIADFDLHEVVQVHGFVARKVVLAAQRRANRLVVLSWDGPTAEGIVAGKLFEYFGARRPVLAIGGPSKFAVEDLLNETAAGVRCRTVDQIKSEILVALAEHRSGEPRTITEDAVRAYSGEECARRFATVLDCVVSERTALRSGL